MIETWIQATRNDFPIVRKPSRSVPSCLVGFALPKNPRRILARPLGDAASGPGCEKMAMSEGPDWLTSSKRDMQRSTSGHTSCRKVGGHMSWSETGTISYHDPDCVNVIQNRILPLKG